MGLLFQPWATLFSEKGQLLENLFCVKEKLWEIPLQILGILLEMFPPLVIQAQLSWGISLVTSLEISLATGTEKEKLVKAAYFKSKTGSSIIFIFHANLRLAGALLQFPLYSSSIAAVRTMRGYHEHFHTTWSPKTGVASFLHFPTLPSSHHWG